MLPSNFRMSFLLPFFQWCHNTSLGVAIRESKVLFPVIEAFHLFALTLLFGSILVLNLRLFAVVMQRQPVPKVARNIAPYMLGSLAVMFISGILLFLSEALKCYGSIPFRIKMVLLFTAIVFHFTIYRKVTGADEGQVKPVWCTMAATISLTLWFGVGIAGRAIAFF